MFVVYGQAEIYLPYSQSLKEKRQIVLGLISRVRKRFNVSIAEVEYQDLWQRASLGFAAVSSSQSELDLIINAIRDTFLNSPADFELLSFDFEITN